MPAFQNRMIERRMVKGSDLIPNPLNYRSHPTEQSQFMAHLLERIGWVSATMAFETPDGLMLIDGELRSHLSPDDDVPVDVVDLNEEEIAIVLASFDASSSMATRRPEVADELKLRIDDGMVLNVFKAYNEQPVLLVDDAPWHVISQDEDDQNVSQDIEQVQEDGYEPFTKRGQIWQLGSHRLMCGDATSERDVRELGVKADLMVTDPPYGVNYSPEWRNEAAEKGQLSYAARRIGRVANDDRVDWSEAYLLFKGDVAYTWSPPGDYLILTGQALQGAGFDIRNQIMWRKPHFPISRGAYTYQHEPCWYGVRKHAKASWVGPANASTVWDITLDKNVEGGHSTQKPLECMERPIRHHKGDIYDPFVGSGTTIIAAEKLGRRCYAMDIEPRYCDVAIRRWEKFTEQTAVLIQGS